MNSTEVMGISVDKAAKRYGLHIGTVFKYIKTGGFKTYKVGRRRIIDVASFDSWMESHSDEQNDAQSSISDRRRSSMSPRR